MIVVSYCGYSNRSYPKIQWLKSTFGVPMFYETYENLDVELYMAHMEATYLSNPIKNRDG